METIEKILREVTEQYIADHVKKGNTDLTKLETEIMQLFKMRCMNANMYARKRDPKLQIPQRLDFARIAQILCAALYVKAVTPPNAKKPELMLWDGRIYAPDKKTIRLKAIELNSCLTDTALQRVENRMLLLADTAEPYTGKQYIAYRNGILDTESGELKPFDPDIVFLSFKNKELTPGVKHDMKED